MVKDRDQLNYPSAGEHGTVFSLEEILAEYNAGPNPKPGESGAPPASPSKPVPKQDRQKVIPFPGEPAEEAESPLTDGIRRLLQAEDDYASHMFEAEEPDPEALRAEQLIPGADEEKPPLRRERKPRPAPAPAPDLPPGELAKRYGKGLGLLRLRGTLVLLLAVLLLGLAAAPVFEISLPGFLSAHAVQIALSNWLLAGAMALSADVLGTGLLALLRGRPGMDTLTVFACAVTLADGLTMLRLDNRQGSLPYGASAALGLFFVIWGTYRKRKGFWQACRTAAGAAEPYLVTLDEGKWSGRDAYAKTSAPLHGFGSQIQGEDGAGRVFRIAVPLLMLSCLFFSLISSLGTRQPEHLLWCLSATLMSCASFSGLLCFGMPFSIVSSRLSRSGAALAGWEGARWAGKNNGILLTDSDLFPPGTVSLNGIKIFGDFSVEKVVAVTATLIRAADGGLDKTFHDLLRTQGATYRRASEVVCYEGGITGQVYGEQILVGTADFMALMEIALPQGLGVKNAVFCAIEGELAGIFALNYTLHSTISPSLSALIKNKIRPVLVTRDFNLFPAMLRQRFKLPVEKMEFPEAGRRRELSDPRQEHSGVITAVLCREGLYPFSEAVVGAYRLRQATRFNAALTVVGSVVGLLLTFYLTYISAYGSLTPANLTAFLLLWTVPTLLISGWVDRY